MAITPGPWNWIPEDSALVMLGQVNNELEHHVLSCHRCKACATRGAPCMTPNIDDANLIASSLELLTACEVGLRHLERFDKDYPGDWEAFGIINVLKNAINKAKGIK